MYQLRVLLGILRVGRLNDSDLVVYQPSYRACTNCCCVRSVSTDLLNCCVSMGDDYVV